MCILSVRLFLQLSFGESCGVVDKLLCQFLACAEIFDKLGDVVLDVSDNVGDRKQFLK